MTGISNTEDKITNWMQIYSVEVYKCDLKGLTLRGGCYLLISKSSFQNENSF